MEDIREDGLFGRKQVANHTKKQKHMQRPLQKYFDRME